MDDLDQEAARARLDYDPETGGLRWRPRNSAWWDGRYAGKDAFTYKMPSGYLQGSLFDRRYKAHRVIWLMVHGYWPKGVDHINGDRSDNRLCNLREASQRENCRNRRPMRDIPLGVYRSGRKWKATIGHHTYGEQTHLGTFATMEEAAAARKSAEQARGFHPNHGRKEVR